jgi:hypothetical protein
MSVKKLVGVAVSSMSFAWIQIIEDKFFLIILKTHKLMDLKHILGACNYLNGTGIYYFNRL